MLIVEGAIVVAAGIETAAAGEAAAAAAAGLAVAADMAGPPALVVGRGRLVGTGADGVATGYVATGGVDTGGAIVGRGSGWGERRRASRSDSERRGAEEAVGRREG